MLIAKQKLKENIAEYILYMYQLEDVIRAYDMELDAIMENYVRPQLSDESNLGEYREWYAGIIQKMKVQKIEKAGHLLSTRDILVELSYLHNTLMNITRDQKYLGVFELAHKFIEEFKEKSNLKDKNHIEIAFHAMYMKLLLKLQKKEISAETEEGFDAMRIMLAYLSQSYNKMKSGDLDFLKN
jgi:hypothetical protein